VGSSTCQQIDALLYELYGLTEEEIAVVDGRERRGTPTAASSGHV